MHIKKYDYVFIDDGLKYKIYKIVDTVIFIKKCKLNLLFLVNKKYGSTFIYKSKKWVRCKKRKMRLDIDANAEIEGANSNIFCDKKSQNLSEENIIALKKNNQDNPYEVVQKIIDSSTTFKEKTQISKFKYIEKKLKRHLVQFTIYECNIVNLIHYFYKFYPERVCNVRVDYLANILFHVNKNFVMAEKINEKKTENTKLQSEKEIEQNEEDKEKKTTEQNKEDIQDEQNESKEHLENDQLCVRQNVIVYDDSCGMLSAVLNIFFNAKVTVYSLVHKNCSSSLMPFFGIKKYENVFHINILNFDETTYKENVIYLNEKIDFVVPHKPDKEKNDSYLNGNDMEIKKINKNLDLVENISNKDYGECSGGKREIPVTTESFNEIKKRKTNQEEIDIDEIKEEPLENAQEVEMKKEQTVKEKPDLCVNGKYRNCSLSYEKQKNILHEICDKKAESFVILLSSNFLYESNTNVHLLLETLIKIAVKFLKNDSKFILYADEFVLSNIVMNFLHTTNSFINIKLNEYILREQQVIKRRTHPKISSAKLADGFLITATKVAC